MGLLEGKNAIVTGGSLGIGTAISLDLGKEGANVALTYRSHPEEAQEVARQIEEMGRKAIAYQIDVSNFGAAQEMVDKVVEAFGGLDILVCNAGRNWEGVIWKMTEEQWDRVIAVNLKGYFNFARAATPLFRDQQSGKIVNLTSINGLRGKFGQSNYSASKAGIIGLTKAMARELGRSSVNVNAVAPGLIETEMLRQNPAREKGEGMALEEIVLGRRGWRGRAGRGPSLPAGGRGGQNHPQSSAGKHHGYPDDEGDGCGPGGPGRRHGDQGSRVRGQGEGLLRRCGCQRPHAGQSGRDGGGLPSHLQADVGPGRAHGGRGQRGGPRWWLRTGHFLCPGHRLGDSHLR